jgi:hypothetical protein
MWSSHLVQATFAMKKRQLLLYRDLIFIQKIEFNQNQAHTPQFFSDSCND